MFWPIRTAALFQISFGTVSSSELRLVESDTASFDAGDSFSSSQVEFVAITYLPTKRDL